MIRIVTCFATKKGWRIQHLNIKTTILDGEIDLEFLMEIHEGIILEAGSRNMRKVCQLLKALSGLEQAHRLWYAKIDGASRAFSLTRNVSDHNLYVNSEGGLQIIVRVYVDDLLLTGDNGAKLELLETYLQSKFDMSKLGNLSMYVRVELDYTERGRPASSDDM